MDYIKSEKDGTWYPKETMWKYIHECLCDAIDYFSEDDLNNELYIIIDHVADEVFKKIKK